MRYVLLIALLFPFAMASCGGDKPARPSPADANNSAGNDGPVVAATGIMIGEVTADSALAQVRLSQTDKLIDRNLAGAPGVVQFELTPAHSDASAQPSAPIILAAETVAEHDFIARVQFSNLKPGTSYRCQTKIGPSRDALQAGPTAKFRTLPGAEQPAKVEFVVVTGMNYAKFHGDDRIDREKHLINNNTELAAPYSGPDKPLGYPALATIAKLQPDFFVGTGDNVYYDTPTDPRATTIGEMRQKWHEQFIQPRYRELFAAVPTYWEIDDHDYRYDDADNTGDEAPSPALGKRVMLEQLPFAAADAAEPKTYRTHRVSPDLQVWFTENRWYRSPNKTPDGPDKTIWGAEQKAWLKQTLKESDATFRVLISPTPMIGPDDLRKIDNHADIGGFRHERDEFFAWLKSEGLLDNHFYVVCGDRHWQYHSVDPSGVEEFSCGALVDENARLGRKPGDPKSTDPEGLVKQPYCQDPASGGFLLVRSAPAANDQPATLTFGFLDEHGKVLYEHEKKATNN